VDFGQTLLDLPFFFNIRQCRDKKLSKIIINPSKTESFENQTIFLEYLHIDFFNGYPLY
jgi:hypothetical protein